MTLETRSVSEGASGDGSEGTEGSYGRNELAVTVLIRRERRRRQLMKSEKVACRVVLHRPTAAI